MKSIFFRPQCVKYTPINPGLWPYAQGPAAIGARYGDIAVCSLDTLGLRPLWFSETEKEYIFSSERGAIPLEDMVTDSRPLAPGEKMGLVIHRGQGIEVLTHRDIRQQVMNANLQRDSLLNQPAQQAEKTIQKTESNSGRSNSQELVKSGCPWYQAGSHNPIDEKVLSAAGWNSEHIQEVIEQAKFGLDPVGSLGFDGPLAALSRKRVNLADYFKETVAVVTNPAIDRGREPEAFSTRTLVGKRPEIGSVPEK